MQTETHCVNNNAPRKQDVLQNRRSILLFCTFLSEKDRKIGSIGKVGGAEFHPIFKLGDGVNR